MRRSPGAVALTASLNQERFMYAVLRRYNVNPGSTETIVNRVNGEFLPTISQLPGFISYLVLDPGDGTLASISVFEDRAGAEESTRAATAWVREHLGHMIRSAPVIATGTVVAQSTAGALK